MNSLLIIAACIGVASAGVYNVGGAVTLNAGRTNRHLVYDVPYTYTYGDAGVNAVSGYNGLTTGTNSYSYLYRTQNQPQVQVQKVPLVSQATYVAPKAQSVVSVPQVSTYTVAAPAVSTYHVKSAPVVQTVQAAPVVQTVQAAPVVQTVQAAPVVQTVQAAPVVHTVHQSTPVVQSRVVPVQTVGGYTYGSNLGGYTYGSGLGGYTLGSSLGGYTLGGSTYGGSYVYHK